MTCRRGFSLLEMLLTLAMSVVLMGLISEAIRFYGRQMDGADEDFRRVQLATKILQMIEDDLRMASVTRPVDTAPLSEVLTAAAGPMSDLMPSEQSEDEQSEDVGGTEFTDQAISSDSATTGAAAEAGSDVDLLAATATLQTPGLIGNATQLQVDVSRLPGLESLAIDPALAGFGEAGELLDRPSDLKTVAYFVVEGAAIADPVLRLRQNLVGGASKVSATGQSVSGGLVRRSLDRAITSHATSTGGLSRLMSNGDLIAEEVVGIEFEYFDGVMWLPQFSSDEAGHLPIAVRVTLTWRDRAGESTEIGAVDRQFSHLIFLPSADREQLAEASEPTDESVPPLAGEGVGQ